MTAIKKIALIPAYEPSPVLLSLLESLKNDNFDITVVDDGSGEKFKDIFDKAKQYATVLVHPVNRGKGAALKTGLEHIGKNAAEGSVIVTLDADGQHSVEDAGKVCTAAYENDGALILGSRGFDNNVPARSRFGNGITRFVYRIATGAKVFDTQTGLRAFSYKLIPLMLSIKGERYEYEMNMLLECPRRHIPIREVRIRTIYFDNNSGSHFNTFRDSARVYREILKFAASSLVGFLVDYTAYSLFVWLLGGLGNAVSVPVSNVAARIISASVNFTINKKFVFKSSGSTVRSAVMYFLLASFILAGNTLLLGFLVEYLGVNKYAGKLITEIIFFTLSWLVQKFLIFRRKKPKPENVL
jgi:glycosyltransferase involved in cell wall biosynthesis